eukprot:GEMP01089632.1.p1 GENE.GEMP01089632.1~~GEMP01089632.1.p1  ORF type:complete len:197 (+),score=34.40 GEMP01089632.1:326-916(+)
MCRGTVPFAAYKTYFASGAYSNSLVLLFLAMTFILAEASGIAMDLWLAQWTDDVLKIGSDSPRYIEIYAAIAFGYFVLQLARSMLFTLFGYRVAVVLHNQLMRGVVKSPLRFFDATPSGRILNRASNDVSGVDFQLTNRWYVLILTSLAPLYYLIQCPATQRNLTPILLRVEIIWSRGSFSRPPPKGRDHREPWVI